MNPTDRQLTVVNPTAAQVPIEELLAGLKPKELYSTVGVYANGIRVRNTVLAQDLLNHVAYNLLMRPGRAFFVEGRCLNQGYLARQAVSEIESQLIADPQVLMKRNWPYR